MAVHRQQGRLNPDTAFAASVALVYSASLAMLSVTLPLLALASHYSKPLIGLLTASSAITQLIARLASAPAMRKVRDKNLVAAASLVLAASGLLLVASHAVAVFVTSELVQGVARGVFWTATQSHMVRSRRSAVGRLATVNFISSFGLLSGPPLAGVLVGHSFDSSLGVAALLGLIAAALALGGMERLELFSADRSGARQKLFSLSGVQVGCAAGITAGAWRGLVNSYIPVVLVEAAESSALVGVMVAVANGSSIVGSGLMGALGGRRTRAAFVVSVLLSGAGVAMSGVLAHSPYLVAVAMAASGLGAGLLQTLGPAAAAMSVAPNRRGDAVALAGSFRAGALFVSPIATAGLLDLESLPPALAVVGAALALPVLLAWRWVPLTQSDGSRPAERDAQTLKEQQL